MVEPFARAAFALKPYTMSDVVQTQFGCHLILVTDRKAGQEVKFADVKDEVRETISSGCARRSWPRCGRARRSSWPPHEAVSGEEMVSETGERGRKVGARPSRTLFAGAAAETARPTFRPRLSGFWNQVRMHDDGDSTRASAELAVLRPSHPLRVRGAREVVEAGEAEEGQEARRGAVGDFLLAGLAALHGHQTDPHQLAQRCARFHAPQAIHLRPRERLPVGDQGKHVQGGGRQRASRTEPYNRSGIAR